MTLTSKLIPRGGWRGPSNRGRSFRQNFNNWNRSDGVQRPPSPPLGPLLERLDESDLVDNTIIHIESDQKATITDCTYLASFNWLDNDEPTILIPGVPPAWTPLEEPRQLEEDHGDFYRDPNAARFPKYPLEPAVRTILAENEEFETQKIDLFACSSTMGSLLRFARQVDREFRFFVEVIGNTVFFVRHENSPTELIADVRGYGHTFPDAYTTWDADVKGSVSHQRMLTYNFGGLNCVIRFECDGYIKTKVPPHIATSLSMHGNKEDEIDDDLDVESLLNGMKVSSSMGLTKNTNPTLQTKTAGRKIPQDAVFDLKTRSSRRKGIEVLKEELPRYWVAQIPNFILAWHDRGVFNDINVQEIGDDVKKWEEENQHDIWRLNVLIRKIIDVAKKREDGKLEVCCKSVASLELREQDTNEHDVLPPNLKLQWLDGFDSSEEELSSSDNDYSPGLETHERYFDSYSGYSSEESEKDYTACSAHDCGYCGHCSY